jgi:hypothetical protein
MWWNGSTGSHTCFFFRTRGTTPWSAAAVGPRQAAEVLGPACGGGGMSHLQLLQPLSRIFRVSVIQKRTRYEWAVGRCLVGPCVAVRRVWVLGLNTKV